MARMAAIMKRLHDAPLTEVAGTPVTLQKDYLTGQMTVPGQAAEPMELKDSDVVAYDLADGSTFIIRPSGTEPKIKVYILANGADQAECQTKVQKYAAFADTIQALAP